MINQPLESLRGVGPGLARRLAEAGIGDVSDLLFHLPLRYQDRTRITPIVALQDGVEALIEGEVRLADVVMGRRRSLVVKLQDGSGTATLRFFHFSAAQRNKLRPGCRLRCFGQVRLGAGGPEFVHPEYRDGAGRPDDLERTLTPVYPQPGGISQYQWRRLCGEALTRLSQADVPDLLPGDHACGYDLAGALRYLHQPPVDAPLARLREGSHPAQERLALEELVAHQLSLRALRRRARAVPAPPMTAGDAEIRAFLSRLPFTPTAAQRRVQDEIDGDLASRRPMLRLVQGDVGSGKTLVAALAARRVIANGYQVAIMAPTELLAEQHRRNFGDWFRADAIGLEWLSGRSRGRARQQALAKIRDGSADLVVGTHALFQDDVSFARLGLVIIDEQHRFGVHQRLALQAKAAPGWRAHQLVMTATPIPRTLSMVAYADLDCSVIDELPPGRQPVQTRLIDSARRSQVIERVGEACAAGRQAYWVCTLVEESDVLQARAAEAQYRELSESLPQLRIGLVHGRQKAAEKEQVMADFKAGAIDLLVATTVIEVGVDVPRASLMIIDNPERLGLAQLHQLRGRVGRGAEASHCLLLFQEPLSRQGRERLRALRESNDGFFLAEKDLELRGPGEVLGTRQTGLMSFRVARLPEHEHLLERVQRAAAAVETRGESAVDGLLKRWIGGRDNYAGV